jgi:S1-C subfamily serine protease
MRATPLYSRAKGTGVNSTPETAAPPPSAERTAPAPLTALTPTPSPPVTATAPPSASLAGAGKGSRQIKPTRLQWLRGPRLVWSALALCLLASVAGFVTLNHRLPPVLTQDDIDKAVRHTLAHHVIPSQYARAYEAISPSVVRVVGHSGKSPVAAPKRGGPPTKTPSAVNDDDDDSPPSIGTGVVIRDNGTILTNLHVVDGADRLTVEFYNGMTSSAEVVRVDSSHDLAVLKADRIPDDLQAATLRGTADLRPGDEVAAVGFPFGIGPSVSGGVVSGLHREFAPGGMGGPPRRSGRPLADLIQFDAAAHPGNSGGPLGTMEGEVVGIVTAILNPTQPRTFVGIGFAVPIESAAAAVGMPPF